MKDKITEEMRTMYREGIRWWKKEVEYVKLTAAEKFTILISAMVVGAVCSFIGVLALILFSFALVEVFQTFMCPALAYLSVGGVFVVLLLVIYALRKVLVINPLARFITKLIINKKEE